MLSFFLKQQSIVMLSFLIEVGGSRTNGRAASTGRFSSLLAFHSYVKFLTKRSVTFSSVTISSALPTYSSESESPVSESLISESPA